MNATQGSWLVRVGAWPLWVRILVLLLPALVLFAAISPVAYANSGIDGVMALGVAAVACLLGALSALLVGELLSGPKLVLASVGMGMLLRMGIPLAACLVVHARGGWLAEAGMIYYLLVYYPVLLAVETGLTVSRNAYQQHVAHEGATAKSLLPQRGDG